MHGRRTRNYRNPEGWKVNVMKAFFVFVPRRQVYVRKELKRSFVPTRKQKLFLGICTDALLVSVFFKF